jgi:hypothetical protein
VSPTAELFFNDPSPSLGKVKHMIPLAMFLPDPPVKIKLGYLCTVFTAHASMEAEGAGKRPGFRSTMKSPTCNGTWRLASVLVRSTIMDGF